MCAGGVESELLHTYSQAGTLDVLLLCVRVAVLVAVTLTVPVVLFPVRHPSPRTLSIRIHNILNVHEQTQMKSS